MANKTNYNFLIWIAVAGLAAFLIFAPSSPFAPSEDTPLDPGTTIITGCAIEDISYTPSLTRLGRAGTSLGTITNYYITTDGLGATRANTAKTLGTNYVFDAIFGENSTTYYSVYLEGIDTDCQDPKFHAVQLAYYDATLNSKYIENSDGSVNADTNEEAMDGDSEFAFTVVMKAGSDEYFGNPSSDCQNIAVVEYDKTHFTKVTGDNPVAVPGSFSYANTTYDGSNAFYIPKVGDGAKAEFNLIVESASTAPNASSQDLTITLLDCDIDKNEDTLAIIEGVEDEDLNSISLASQQLVVYID